MIGNLIKDSNDEVVLCLSKGVSVQFNPSSEEKNYYMDNDGTNIFTFEVIENNGIVIKAINNIFTFNNYFEGEKYLVQDTNLFIDRSLNYCEGNLLNNLYQCEHGFCTAIEKYLDKGCYLIEGKKYYCCTYSYSDITEFTIHDLHCSLNRVESGMFIFMTMNYDNEYEIEYTKSITTDLKEDDEDLDKLRMYHCYKGECIETVGFKKLKNNKIMYCDSTGCDSTYVPVTECNYDTQGKMGLINEEYKLCLRINENTYQFEKINYIVLLSVNKDDINKYDLYINRGYGYGKAQFSGYVAYDIDKSGKSTLVSCSNGICERTTDKSGYYMYLGDTREIYNCRNSKCILHDLHEKAGYFINSDNEVFSCDKDQCQMVNIDPTITDNCHNKSNKFITYTGGIIKYCTNDGNMVEFAANDDEIKYYGYDNVADSDSNIDFPTLIPFGPKSLILKVSKYSILKYNEKSIMPRSYCIDNNNSMVDCSAGLTQYTCEYYRNCKKTIYGSCDPLEENPNSLCNGYYIIKGNTLIQDINTVDGTLWNCEKENNSDRISCQPVEGKTIGYFKVSDVKYQDSISYIKCSGEGQCQGLVKPTDKYCNIAGIGNFVLMDNDEVGVCITDNDLNPIIAPAFTPSLYFISNSKDTIFAKADTS